MAEAFTPRTALDATATTAVVYDRAMPWPLEPVLTQQVGCGISAYLNGESALVATGHTPQGLLTTDSRPATWRGATLPTPRSININLVHAVRLAAIT